MRAPGTAGLAELLPATEGDVAAPVAGTVFKIERDPTGHRIAYVSLSAGTLRVRAAVSPLRTVSRPLWIQ